MMRLCIVAGLCLCPMVVGCTDVKDPVAPAADESVVDARAREVLTAMSETLTGAGAFSVQTTGMMDEALDDGATVRLHRRSTLHLRRPDRLRVQTVGDDVDRICWYNGRTLTVLDKLNGEYASVEAPDTIDAMLDFVVEQYGLTIPIADLLLTDPDTSLLANVYAGDYLGIRSMAGRQCHHLAFRQQRIDWQIWIDAGDVPVPRKLVIIYKTEPGYPEYSVNLDSWDLSERFGEGVFESAQPFEGKAVTMDDLLGIAEGE